MQPWKSKDSSETEKKRSPADFLKAVLGRPVNVKLNSGTDYKGVLACLDGYMNIAMEQTEEYQDGQLKAKYGDCFIRGNNGKFFFEKEKTIHTIIIFQRRFLFHNTFFVLLLFYSFIYFSTITKMKHVVWI